jgi:hypothetical protein
MRDLTQDVLKKNLHYDPASGIFTRLIESAHNSKAGSEAGCRDASGYCKICVAGTQYLAHRLAVMYMTGEFPPSQVDHINGCRHDNRWENLRPVSRSENQRNMKLKKNNTSGAAGVSWNKCVGKWESSIRVPRGPKKTLGYFEDFDSAVAARKQAEARFGYHENHGRAA